MLFEALKKLTSDMDPFRIFALSIKDTFSKTAFMI